MKILISELEQLVLQALQKKYSKEDSRLIADVILFGELSGKKSHGVVRLISGTSSMLYQKPKKCVELISKTKLSTLIIGNDNPAMLVGSMATNEVIALAKEMGFGIVGTNTTHSTSGCLSYYLEQIALSGLIGIVMARSPLCISPFNSIERLFGTNPIGFSFPTSSQPVLLDIGGSVISWGELLKAKATHSTIPNNSAIDKEGNTTTDPEEAMEGSLLPFDRSYKSSGLTMVVEILAGVLPGAGFLDINNDYEGWGNIFLAISPTLLLDEAEFEKKMDQFVKRMKSSKTKDGTPIRISGERTLKTRNDTLKKGEVEVADELIEGVRRFLKTGELL